MPTQDVQQYVGEHPVTRVFVDVFPAATETSFNYYDDDGITYAYEKGAFFEQRLSTQRQRHNRSFRCSRAHGNL